MSQMMPNCLPKSGERNKYSMLYRETEGNADEKLLAVYIEALKEFDWNPSLKPMFPTGYPDDHNAYIMIEGDKQKSEAWKALRSKYFGYYEQLDEAIAKDISDLNFLRQAKEHFLKLELKSYADRVDSFIARFPA